MYSGPAVIGASWLQSPCLYCIIYVFIFRVCVCVCVCVSLFNFLSWAKVIKQNKNKFFTKC